MKLISLSIVLISLVGCEAHYDRPVATYKGTQIPIICVDGIAYLKWSTYSITPKLHQDGKPYICVDTDTRIIIK